MLTYPLCIQPMYICIWLVTNKHKSASVIFKLFITTLAQRINHSKFFKTSCVGPAYIIYTDNFITPHYRLLLLFLIVLPVNISNCTRSIKSIIWNFIGSRINKMFVHCVWFFGVYETIEKVVRYKKPNETFCQYMPKTTEGGNDELNKVLINAQ